MATRYPPPMDQPNPDPIVDDELACLRRVRQYLEEQPYVLPAREGETVAELVRLREELPTAKEEDKPALLMQYDHQHALLQQLRSTRDQAQVDPDSPYFAHLRLVEDDRSRDVFIGKGTRIQGNVRIVDWRNAPISRLYYAYQQGEEYEETYGESVHTGEIAARRTVTVRRGQLDRVDCPEGTYVRAGDVWSRAERTSPRLAGGAGTALRGHDGPGGGQRRLGTAPGGGTRADKHLPDIAGLIDPDQFALITRPSAGYVVVRGTAGSGKTTVALHRIAWLAFEDPDFDSERTLFLVFSPALREYVSHVLPALGVSRVRIREFREWASELRRRHFPKLPTKVSDDAPAAVVRMMLHPMLHTLLERQVQRVPFRPHPGAHAGALPGPEHVWDDVVSVLTDLDRLTSAVAEFAPAAFDAADIQRIATWWREKALRVELRDDTTPGERSEGAVPFLDVEDDAVLLHAWQLRVGPLLKKGGGPLRYKHVAIDEVQDLAAIEVRVVLGCLDERRSLTLAGDTQQHVAKDGGFTSWSRFLEDLGLTGSHVDTLRIAYRSTRPIVELAQHVLGDLREDEPPLVDRDGPPAELFQFTDHGAAVAFLADALKEVLAAEPSASIVLLAPSEEIAATYGQGLLRAEVPRLRRIVAHDFTFAPGIEIAPVASVKGLEFDYVVILEASAQFYPDRPEARRLLHVAATRAIHQLWLTTVGSPSSLLPPAA